MDGGADFLKQMLEDYGPMGALVTLVVGSLWQSRRDQGPSVPDRLANAERDAAQAAQSSKANGKRLDVVDGKIDEMSRAVSDLAVKIAHLEGRVKGG